jgi:hypothetical protein
MGPKVGRGRISLVLISHYNCLQPDFKLDKGEGESAGDGRRRGINKLKEREKERGRMEGERQREVE